MLNGSLSRFSEPVDNGAFLVALRSLTPRVMAKRHSG
jgi:hypothetical protein